MIRPVDTSLLDAVAKTAPSAPAQAGAAESAGKNAFASQLKKAAEKSDGTTPAKESAKDAAAEPRTAARATPPEGEKWRPVKGRDDYAEIIAGERKGQFVNLNRGARRGEAFTIEQRDGKTVHVYKRGEGELVVPIKDDKEATAARSRGSDREPPKGETWAPVEGMRSYADILSGPRNGYYVNLQQGSVREGHVFHIVKRGEKQFHVYGQGDDKIWVEVGPNKKKATKAEAGAATEATAPAAGAADSRDATTTAGGTTKSGGTAATPAS